MRSADNKKFFTVEELRQLLESIAMRNTRSLMIILFILAFSCMTETAYSQISKISPELKQIIDKGGQDTSEYDIEIYLKDTQAEHYEPAQHMAILKETGELILNGNPVSEEYFETFTKKTGI